MTAEPLDDDDLEVLVEVEGVLTEILETLNAAYACRRIFAVDARSATARHL